MKFKAEGKCTVSRILRQKEYFEPKVLITLNALLKMKGYVEHCDTEVAWLGLVEREDDTYIISDVDLMQQDVSAATAEIHEKGLQEYAERFINKGDVDSLSKIRVWGHSHVNMGTSPSATDEETFAEYCENCDFFIRIIANKKGKITLDLADMSEDLRFDNVQWEVLYPETITDLLEEIEIAEGILKELNDELTAISEGNYKLIEASVKKEIKNHVVEEKPYKYSLPSNNKNNNVSYLQRGWDDESSFSDTTYLTPYLISVIDKGGKEDWDDVQNVFNDHEIIQLVENTISGREVKALCEHMPVFKHYNDLDWNDLHDTLDDYYMNAYEYIGGYSYGY